MIYTLYWLCGEGTGCAKNMQVETSYQHHPPTLGSSRSCLSLCTSPSLCDQGQFTLPLLELWGRTSVGGGSSWCLVNTDTLGRTVGGHMRQPTRQILVGALLQRLGERGSWTSPPNLGILSCLVLGTSLHPPANWALGQSPSSSIQLFCLG